MLTLFFLTLFDLLPTDVRALVERFGKEHELILKWGNDIIAVLEAEDIGRE